MIQQENLVHSFSTPDAADARNNIHKICERHFSGKYEIEVGNVLEDFRRALESRALITPTLLLVDPPPPARIVGTLSAADLVTTAVRAGEAVSH